jgi:hypothetical protein
MVRASMSAVTRIAFLRTLLVLSTQNADVFSMALMPFEDAKEHHVRLLQSVFKALTGDVLDCPRFGGHWEVCGFQGNDPATDLRGAGMLALLQLLSFSTGEHRELALKIFNLSRDPVQNFPFAVVSVNLTGLALQCLREARIYNRIKQVGSVMTVMNDLHAALFYEMMIVWKKEFRTIRHFGETQR